jgi:hypothetical protein
VRRATEKLLLVAVCACVAFAFAQLKNCKAFWRNYISEGLFNKVRNLSPVAPIPLSTNAPGVQAAQGGSN